MGIGQGFPGLFFIMTLSQIFIFLAIILYCFYRIYQTKIQPHLQRKKFLLWSQLPEVSNTLQLIEETFEAIDGFAPSLIERDEKSYHHKVYTYGEIKFLSFAEILFAADPKAGDIFYDLGAGVGKAVVCAGLLFDLKAAYGIEKLTSIHQLSMTVQQRLLDTELSECLAKRVKTIEFLHDDFFEVDFTNADILFINATCFGDPLWRKMQEKLKTLKPKAKVIVTSKSLNKAYFKQLHCLEKDMSWASAYVSIYQRY